jgi:hypothetical protein
VKSISTPGTGLPAHWATPADSIGKHVTATPPPAGRAGHGARAESGGFAVGGQGLTHRGAACAAGCGMGGHGLTHSAGCAIGFAMGRQGLTHIGAGCAIGWATGKHGTANTVPLTVPAPGGGPPGRR